MEDHADITVVGAREHNLKDVSLRIPSNRITVFTGVSGSGKSSLVFDTIAVEAQRQLNATFSWYARNHLPRHERPDVDVVENLTAPVVVDQSPLGGNARSTVGTVTDIASIIRVLFSRCGQPRAEGLTFSFNDPASMCAECSGLGVVRRGDLDAMLDRSLSLDEGAILLPSHKVGSIDWQLYARSGRFDTARALADYPDEQWHDLLHGSGGQVTLTTANTTNQLAYEGLLDRFERVNLARDLSTLSDRARAGIEPFLAEVRCPACEGARLNPTALGSRIDGLSIANWMRLEIGDLVEVLTALGGTDGADGAVLASAARAAAAALGRVVDAGLGYLSLERPTTTLSGGEGQRLKMVRHLGSSLVGMTYVFDEPSTGLHPRDVGRVNDMLRALRDRRNTVIVVEHDPDVIAVADHVVDIGPGPGTHGGQVQFTGTYDELRAADTPTGAGLRRGPTTGRTPRTPTGTLPVRGATGHNLQQVSVDLPTGVLTAITGVSGSGKSSLVDHLCRHAGREVVHVDQSAIPASSRSTPATFLGVMDAIRKTFAKATGAPASAFSFNSTGACATCGGRGVVVTELAGMDTVTSRCDACGGRRFTEEVLAHRLRGHSIADVLEMPTEEAVAFLAEGGIAGNLRPVVDVGLAYLTLGQALSTLSGGERQRLKLAAHLHRRGEVFVLDEPTTGLHLADVDLLIGLLDRMVDEGDTVILVEHNLDVIAAADHIVDMGPGGGRDGGRVVAAGGPDEVMATPESVTGRHLRAYLDR